MAICFSVRIWRFGLAAFLCFGAFAAQATPFDCKSNHCGIAMDAPYPNLAIGTIDGIATPAQTASILATAQKSGLWRVFPSDSTAFVANVQPVSISVAPGHSLTVLSATWEARLSHFKLGQLVRFSPHRSHHEVAPPNDPYFVGIGCVAMLCIPGDDACQAGYRPGLYRVSDGAELDASGRHVVPGGVVIDTMSMRPKTNGD